MLVKSLRHNFKGEQLHHNFTYRSVVIARVRVISHSIYILCADLSLSLCKLLCVWTLVVVFVIKKCVQV